MENFGSGFRVLSLLASQYTHSRWHFSNSAVKVARHEALNLAPQDCCGACQERCCETLLKILNSFIPTADPGLVLLQVRLNISNGCGPTKVKYILCEAASSL